MTDRPSAGDRATTDIARLVDELRARTTRIKGMGLNAGTADLLTRAADALEAQARELAAKDKLIAALDQERDGFAQLAHGYKDRIAALEDAARVKDEALRPFATIAEDYADQEDDDFQVWRDFDVLGATLPLRNFRRARIALASGWEGGA